MKNIIITSLVLTAVLFSSCSEGGKKNLQGKKTPSAEKTSVKPLLAQAEKESMSTQKNFYVTASSGLSLRAGSNLNSNKILTLPYGAQVKFLSSPAHTEMKVEGIEGKMLEIDYQGAIGFAFDGYLSSLAPPQTDEDIESYAKRISTTTNPIQVLKKADKKGENYGMTTSIEIPAKTWNEMYKVSQRLFNLPQSIRPDLSNKTVSKVIINKAKRERTFKDELAITTTSDGQLKDVTYTYQLRDYHRTVTITKTANGFKAVEVETSM